MNAIHQGDNFLNGNHPWISSRNEIIVTSYVPEKRGESALLPNGCLGADDNRVSEG